MALQPFTHSDELSDVYTKLSGVDQLITTTSLVDTATSTTVRKLVNTTQATRDAGENLQISVNNLSTQGGGILYLNAGTHIVTSALTIPSNIHVQGVSEGSTTIVLVGTANLTMTGGSVYTTGTISSISGGVNVVGSGTTWTSAMIGRQIFINNRWYVISAFTDTTHITIATGYADGATFSGTYRISDVVHDVKIKDVTITGSTGTGIVGTDVREFVMEDCLIASNNKGLSLTNFMNIDINRAGVASSTSNGTELTHGSFFNTTDFYNVSNGGHGIVINDMKVSRITYSASDANTSDGLNCTSTINCVFQVEASGNGGQGIEFVSGCNDNVINGYFFNGNTSDGIKLTATSDTNTIYGNLQGNGGFGINIAASTCDNNVIMSPIYAGNTSGTLNDSGTTTKVL